MLTTGILSVAFLTSLTLAGGTPPRPVNVCDTDTSYLIQSPPPTGYRCLAPVKPIGSYQKRALIVKTTQQTFYDCNKQCFVDANCKAQLYEPYNDGSDTGDCSTYNRGAGPSAPGSTAVPRLMKGDPNAQFSNKNCIYTPSCLQVVVKTADSVPAFQGQFLNTFQSLDGYSAVQLSTSPQYYYFNTNGALVSDFNGYLSKVAEVVPGVSFGAPGSLTELAFPSDQAVASGVDSVDNVSWGYYDDRDTFEPASANAGAIAYACSTDNIVRLTKNEADAQALGCSELILTIIR